MPVVETIRDEVDVILRDGGRFASAHPGVTTPRR